MKKYLYHLFINKEELPNIEYLINTDRDIWVGTKDKDYGVVESFNDDYSMDIEFIDDLDVPPILYMFYYDDKFNRTPFLNDFIIL